MEWKSLRAVAVGHFSTDTMKAGLLCLGHRQVENIHEDISQLLSMRFQHTFSGTIRTSHLSCIYSSQNRGNFWDKTTERLLFRWRLCLDDDLFSQLKSSIDVIKLIKEEAGWQFSAGWFAVGDGVYPLPNVQVVWGILNFKVAFILGDSPSQVGPDWSVSFLVPRPEGCMLGFEQKSNPYIHPWLLIRFLFSCMLLLCPHTC